MKNMKMYMAYAGDCPEEGALLVFASSVKEAKAVVYPEASCLLGCEYIEMRVNMLHEEAPHLMAAADQDKISKGIPHVVDNPPCCDQCGVWGVGDYSLKDDGICIGCHDLNKSCDV